ncbi:hypothetical protein IW262DRAFT_344403 [Armillaria fumosa]|nr:hypothetical protein IW262DRAFT_344403 [Armillaria fumosa]
MTDEPIKATRNLPITDYIPPEIIDAVIDCLRGDKDSLLACSFVCRVFRPRTRVHLFHTLELKFNGTLNIDPDNPSFKRVIGYIEEIKLQGVVSPLHIPSRSEFLPSPPKLASLSLSFILFRDPWHLHVLISRLPSLRDLDLKNVFFENQNILGGPSQSESLEFPRIKRISLYRTSSSNSVVESLFRREDCERSTSIRSMSSASTIPRPSICLPYASSSV